MLHGGQCCSTKMFSGNNDETTFINNLVYQCLVQNNCQSTADLAVIKRTVIGSLNLVPQLQNSVTALSMITVQFPGAYFKLEPGALVLLRKNFQLS